MDDNNFNLEVLSMYLEKLTGVAPKKASDGAEAVEIFKQSVKQPKCKNCKFVGIALIFMDLNMPEKDGF